MAVTKQQKAEIIADLEAKIKAAKSIGFAKTNALSVSEFEAMRKSLRSVNANYTVAKKTIIVKAIKNVLDIDIDLKTLPGQIGMVCSNDDAIAGLAKVNEVVTKTKGEKVNWTVSIFEGALQDEAATKAIAGMPSRETLLGRLVGSMQAPLAGLARWFDAAAKDLETQGKDSVGKLEAKKEAKVETAAEVKAEEAPVEVKSEEVSPETEAPATEEAKAE